MRRLVLLAVALSAVVMTPAMGAGWSTTKLHEECCLLLSDLAVGDGPWNLGKSDVWFVGSSGVWWTFHIFGNFTTERLRDLPSAALAVGDGDRDGKSDLFVTDTGGRVYKMVDSGPGGLYPWHIATIGGNADTLTIGDVENDGLRELYAVNGTGGVYKIWYSGGVWQNKSVTSVGVRGITSWFADGDRDGKPELYVGGEGGGAYQVKKVGSAWRTTRIVQHCCGTAASVEGIVAGDGNRDGKVEVYGLQLNGQLRKYTWTGTQWNNEPVGTFPAGAQDLTLGDANNDGLAELYLTAGREFWRVAWNGTTWVKARIGVANEALSSLAIGDADNDGKREVYGVTQRGALYTVKP